METGFTPDQSTRLESIRRMPLPIPRGERHKVDLRTVGVGGYIRFGRETYEVKAVTVYRETDWKWTRQTGDEITELTLYSLISGKTVYIEWSFDDTLEVYRTLEKLRMSQLQNADTRRGVRVQDLDDFDHDEDGVTYKGHTFWYDDEESYAAIWVADADRMEEARFYEFWCDETNTALTIEVWGAEADPEVFISKEMGASEIEILVLAA